MGLTREQLLATKPPKPEAVPWLNGEVVYVAAWNSAARDSFEKENLEVGTSDDPYSHLENIRARLLVRCLVDENGERLLTDDDAAELGQCWAVPMDRAFAVAKRLCAFSQADLEELEKNYGSAPSDCSGST